MDYYLHNTSRSVHTRAQRYSAPQHGGAKQFFKESRVLRGRPVLITDAEILAHLNELKDKAAVGLIEVRSADGRKLDLSTLQLEGKVTPSPLLPHPVLDSVKNDKPSGVPMPIYPDGAVQLLQVPPAAVEDEDADMEFQESSTNVKPRAKKGRR